MSAQANIPRRSPSVVKGKHLWFESSHPPEAPMLKKAQLPTEGTGQRLWNGLGKFPTLQCQDPCMVKSKGNFMRRKILFLWIISASGFSKTDLCTFRDRVFLWPHRGSIKANRLPKPKIKIKKINLLISKCWKDLCGGRGSGTGIAVLSASAT